VTSALGSLVGPTPVDRFLAEHWEREPLHVARGDAGHFAGVFSSAALEAVLAYSRPKPPDLRVVAQQKDLLPDRYVAADGSLNLNQLYKAFDEGYTLVLNGLDRFSPTVAALARRLQGELNHRVVANAYLTPAGTKALAPHYDNHDVFVVQVEGSKRWSIHPAPVELPLLHTFQPTFAEEGLGAPVATPHLRAGDTLYLPRGFVHRAEANDEPSLHVTLGVHPAQWIDLVHKALLSCALRDVRLRRALPVGYLDRPSGLPGLQATLRDLVAELATEVSALEAVALLEDDLMRDSLPAPDGRAGQFEQVSRQRALAVGTRVEKRPGLRCRFTDLMNGCVLQYPGNRLDASLDFVPALRFVANADGPFTPADLPGELDEGRRLQVVQRLVRGGLLRLVGEP
jgi:ribosomal protein L16 Arg81 hydroxylase